MVSALLAAVTFDSRVDVGTFLTFVTLLGGIAGWSIKEVRDRRRDADDRARSGALRLLLAILRQAGRAMTFDELWDAYHDERRATDRCRYSGRDHRFGDRAEFEAAIYRLDWEGKVDFVSSDQVIFRIDRHAVYEAPMPPALPIEPMQVVAALQAELATDRGEERGWEAERLARLAMNVAPAETVDVLREHLRSTANDPERRRRALLMLDSAANAWAVRR